MMYISYNFLYINTESQESQSLCLNNKADLEKSSAQHIEYWYFQDKLNAWHFRVRFSLEITLFHHYNSTSERIIPKSQVCASDSNE